MTVAELKSILSDMPDDAIVVYNYDTGNGHPELHYAYLKTTWSQPMLPKVMPPDMLWDPDWRNGEKLLVLDENPDDAKEGA